MALLRRRRQVKAPKSAPQRLGRWPLTLEPLEDRCLLSGTALPEGYGRLPLRFEANQGQADTAVQFLSRGSGYSLLLAADEAVLNLHSPDSPAAALHMRLAGANPAPQMLGLEPLITRSNYLIGDDPARWQTNVPNYARVEYPDVYAGIDLVYHGSQRQLEYDFVVAPGADPGVIGLRFEGADRLEIDAQGELVLHTAAGEVRQHKPILYQEVDGIRREVAGGYTLTDDGQVGFVVGAYDARMPLVIDPVLTYSSYLGGAGQDAAWGIAVDAAGNAYVTGWTSSTDFPTANPLQPSSGGGPYDDAFVAKLNATGTALVYTTYLGGSGSDGGFGIAVDAAGNAYVTGYTNSTNFPTANPLQPSSGGGPYDDAFVAKLNATGTALVYSTYLGGSGSDFGRGIAVDAIGNAYVTGYTDSTNFPTANPLQSPHGSDFFDAFVAKVNPTGTALVYSTCLGGSDPSAGSGIAVDAAGNAYVTGWTTSGNFPAAQSLQPSPGGGTDAFVAKLNTTGTALVYTTYLGGSGSDLGYGIAVDAAGSAYVTGYTDSTNFPTANPLQPSRGDYFDAFVAKVNPTGTALVYSTYLGGNGGDRGYGIAVDAEGNAYVTGLTSSTDFPTANSLQPPPDGYDAFVAKLNPTGSALVYSTFLGGTSADEGFGIAVDASGNAYVAGRTYSTDFPTVHALQPAQGGTVNGFVAKIAGSAAFETPSLIVTTVADVVANDGVTSLREAINFANSHPGIDTITFAIPGSGVQTIRPTSALPTITDPVVIDGYSQPGASPNTLPNGDNAVLLIELDGSGAGGNGLRITAGGSTVQGLVINRFNNGIMLDTNGGNVVQGNYVGTDAAGTADLGNNSGVFVANSAGNTIGGTTPAARNVISGNTEGVYLDGSASTGNLVQGNFIGTDVTGRNELGNRVGVDILGSGNTIGGTTAGARNIISSNRTGVLIDGLSAVSYLVTSNVVVGNYIGTDVTGTQDLGNYNEGVYINAANDNTVGGTTSAARNLISGNGDYGILLAGALTAGNVQLGTGNRIQGNFLGTDVTGTSALANYYAGVGLSGANNIIGGTAAGAGNLISGNTRSGVDIPTGFASGNVVQGNLIGTAIDGTSPLPNTGPGVLIRTIGLGNAFNNTLGGTAAGAGNIIAFNEGNGVSVNVGTRNAILANSIFANGGLGIDLGDNGVTANDPGDGDTGPNNLQNFPVLTSAAASAANLIIGGILNSAANTAFRLEFFSNSASDPSGYGEGQTYLGFIDVTTDAGGNASFQVALPTVVPAGSFVTATATDPAGNTSEFSSNRIVIPGNLPPVANPDAYTVNQDIPLIVAAAGVLANDTDPDGDPLTAILVSNPSHGTLTFGADGSFRYLAGTAFAGSDSFSYKANDGAADSNITIVTITVNAGNEAAADFSTAGNPNGVWSYGWSQSLGSAFYLDAEVRNVGVDHWRGNLAGDGAPVVSHNGTANPVTWGSITWQPGQLSLHPGPGGEYAVLRWTAPRAGTVLLEGTFAGLDFVGPTTTDVHVLHNGSVLFNGSVNAFGDGPSFTLTRTLAAGDTIDFAVGFGDNGNFGFDTTGLDAVLRYIGQPPTVTGGAAVTVNEGQVAFASGSYSDPDGDNVTLTASVGNISNTGTDSGTWTWSLATTDGPDQGQTVTITANDGHGGVSTATFTLTVLNVAPTIALSGAAAVNQGLPYTLTLGAVTDPGADTVSGYVVHWGDGNSNTYPGPGNVTHTYAAAGSRTITVDLMDEDGTHAGAGSRQVMVSSAVAGTTQFQVSAPAGGVAGAAFTVTVTARNASGGLTTDYRGTVHLTSSDAAAVLPGDYTFTQADQGTHTFTVTLNTTGAQAVTGTDTAAASITGNAAVLVTRPAVSNFLVSAPAGVVAGQPFNVTVTARDSGQTSSGYRGTIRFSASDELADLPRAYTFTEADGGSHTFQVTLKTAGAQSITATDTLIGSLTGTQQTIAVSPAAASAFLVAAPATPVGVNASTTITVTAHDAYGNAAAGYRGTIHWESSDGQASLPPNYTFTESDQGSHSFQVTLRVAGTQTLTVTDTTTSLAGSSTVAVTTGSATQLQVQAPAAVTAGGTFELTVTALDAAGATAAGYAGTVHFTSSDAAALLPADYTFTAADRGTHTFTVTVRTPGSQSLRVEDTTAAVALADTSVVAGPAGPALSFCIEPPIPIHLSEHPFSFQAGGAIEFVVHALAHYDFLATDYTGTVHFTSSDPRAVLPDDYTFTAADRGTHTFTVTFKTAGSHTLTVTEVGNLGVSGSQAGIEVLPGQFAALLVAPAAPLVTGVSGQITVMAQDEFGNTVPDYTRTVSLLTTDVRATVPPAHTFGASDRGVFAFPVTFGTVGTYTVTARDTLQTSGTAEATVYPHHFRLTVPDSTLPNVPFTVTVTPADAEGNPVFGYTGTVQLTSSDLIALLPPAHTFTDADQGSYTFLVRLRGEGSQTLTASDTAAGSIIGSAVVLVAQAANSHVLSAELQNGIRLALVPLDALGSLVLDQAELDAKLPLLDRSLNELIGADRVAGIGGFLRVREVVSGYFTSTETPTAEGLVQVLLRHTLALTDDTATGNLDFGPVNVTASFVGSQLRFDVAIEASITKSLPLRLGPEDGALSLSGDLTADLFFKLNFSFGLDTTSLMSGGSLAPEDIFFRLDDLAATAHVQTNDLNAGLRLGFFQATVQGGSVDLAAMGRLALVELGGDGKITLADLQQTPLADLVHWAATGTLQATLPVLGRFGDDSATPTDPAEQARLVLATPDLFRQAPSVQIENLHRLLDLSNLSARPLLDALGQFGGNLAQTVGEALRSIPVPFTDLHLGNVFDTVGEAADALLRQLQAGVNELLTGLQQVVDGTVVPAFQTIAEFGDRLSTLLRAAVCDFRPHYDPTTQEVTWHVALEYPFHVELPVDLNPDLGPLASLTTTGLLNVDAHAGLEFTFGAALPTAAVVHSVSPNLPADGRLNADAHFQLRIEGGAPVDVTVKQTDTADNQSLEDLVADINSAMSGLNILMQRAPTLLLVHAALDGNQITLATGPLLPWETSTLEILIGSLNDPAATVLGFRSQIARGRAGSVFVENASVHGDVHLDAQDFQAAARLGFLDVRVGQAAASGEFAFDLALRGPGGSHRIDPVHDAVSALSVVPTVTGSARLDLNHMSADAGFVHTAPSANPSITISIPDINHLSRIGVTTNDLDALLSLSDLSFQDVVAGLRRVVGTLGDYPGLGFLGAKLPFIDRSVTELLDYAAPLAAAADQLQADPVGTVQTLQQQLKQALGLPADSDRVHVTYDEVGKALQVGLRLDSQFHQALAINLDLAQLAELTTDPQVAAFLRGVARLVDVSGHATLNVDAGAVLQLDLGIDLDNTSARYRQPFLYDTTGVTLNVRAQGTDLTFRAAVGSLGLFVQGGSALLDGDGNPATDAPAALTLRLLAGANGRHYITPALLDAVRVELTAGVRLTLPLFFPFEDNPVGGAAPANYLTVTASDLAAVLRGTPGSVQITAPDLSAALDSFRDLTLADIVAGLRRVADGLKDYSEFQFLTTKLPLIDRSITELLDYAAPFAEAVGQLESDPDAAFQSLQQRLLEALGLPLSSDQVHVSYDVATRALKVSLTLNSEFHQALAINLDLAQLAALASDPQVAEFLAALTHLVDVSGQATLDVTASAVLHLDLGFDLDRTSAHYLQPFLYDTTSVTLDAAVRGSNLTFQATVGGLGLFIRGGSVVLNADGDAATTAPASFSIHLANTPSHRHYFSGTTLSDVQVSLTGGVGVTLPLFFPFEDSPLGGAAPANHLGITIPDLAAVLRGEAGSVQLTAPDLDAVLDQFSNLSLSDIVAGLRQAADTLKNYEGFEFLTQKLPLIDRSVTELLDYAASLADAVDQLQADPNAAIQSLRQHLAAALGLPLDSDRVHVTYDAATKALQLSLTLDSQFHQALAIDLDLAHLASLATDPQVAALLGALTRLVAVSGQGDLDVTAAATLQFDLGIDLDRASSRFLQPFLYDSTSVTLDASVRGSNLTFQVTAGGLGLFIRGGSVLLDADGDPATTAPASFSIHLANTPSHRHYFVGTTLSDVQVSLTGGVGVTLPLFFPFEDSPLGGVAPANHLGITIPSLAAVLRGEAGSVQLTAPDLDAVFDQLANLSLSDVIAGLRRAADTLKDYAGFEFLTQKLPLIDRSVTELLDYAASLADAVDQLQADPNAGIQTLRQHLAQALGLPLDSDLVQVTYDAAGQALKVSLTLQTQFHQALAINLDLARLADLAPDPQVRALLGTLTRLVAVSGQGDLDVTAAATLQFDLGIDLGQTPGRRLQPFLYDTTSVTLQAAVRSSNLTFRATVGGLGLFIRGGSVVLDADGNPATAAPASFSIHLVNSENGRHYFTDTMLSDLRVIATGGLGVTLPLFFPFEDSPLGGAAPANHLGITISDLAAVFRGDAGSVQFTAPNLNAVLDQLTHLSFADIVAGLRRAADTLRDYPGFEFLGAKLPLIDRSVTELLDYAQPLAAAVDLLQADPNAGIQTLRQQLAQALGLPLDSDRVHVTYDAAGKALKVSLALEAQFAQSLGIDLDLAALTTLVADEQVRAFLAGLTDLVSVSGSGTVAVTVGAAAHLDLGIDLDRSSDRFGRPFFYDTTGVTFDARVQGSNLTFQAAIGTFGLFVRGGSAVLDQDGNPDTTAPAQFSLGLRDVPGGRHYFTAALLSNFEVTLAAGARVTLPLFFPLESIPAGSPPANNLSISIPSLMAMFRSAPGSVVITTPDLRSGLDRLFSLETLLTQPGALVAGIDSLLGKLQGELDRLGNNLPLVGTRLQDAAQFIQGFRQGILAQLGSAVQGQDPIRLVQQALFGVFGPAGLNLLLDANGHRPDPSAPVADIIGTFVVPRTTADSVQFNIHLGQELLTTLPLTTDLGIPGLGLTVAPGSQLDVRLGWDFRFGFGISLTDGFYLDAAARDAQGTVVPELIVALDIRARDLNAAGHLGFLQLDVTSSTAPTGFSGRFTVDLKAPAGGQRLTFAALASASLEQILETRLGAVAEVNLGLAVSYEGSALFPKILTDFHLHWGFSAADPHLRGEVPQIAFNNVRVDLGSFLTQFAGPILNRVKNVIDPIQPVLKILTDPLPVISDFEGKPTSLIDLAARIDPAHFGAVRLFLDTVNKVYQLANSVPADGSNLVIQFGSFDLGVYDVRNGLSGATPRTTVSAPSFADQVRGTPRAGFATGLMETSGLTFPVMQQPSKLFGLLMGQDVDLFRFATPIFNLGFSYTQEFPILPPLVATVTGRVGASFFLTFGYDTFGVREAFASHNVLDVFDGFFVDTAGSAVLVSASLAVGAALNFVIASGGVEGGLFANVALRLHDPNGDGKLRWKEARDVLATDPLRLFEIRGTVIARLYAWLQIAGMPRTVLDLVPPIDVLALPGALPGTAPTFPPPAPGPAPVPDSPMRLSASVGVVTLAHGFTPPANNPPPAGVEFPAGFVTFQVGGLEPGGSTVVTLSLPWLNALDNGRITTYYKFGRTRDNPTPHWYSFMFDGTTGAKIRTQVRQRVTEGNLETEFLSTVTLYLIDGERGDDDLTANGVIVDPGAPAVAPVPAPAATSPVVIPPAPSTVGVFAPGTATWYLRDSNTPGAPDITPFAYGASGWQPVVGDWNGDGTTTIGVFDPTTATWYLKNSNTPGAPDYKPFAYGMPGWIPVVGDWDGDGITTIGVVDPTTMTWYLRNSNSPGAPDYKPFAYGASGWIPVVGDWDGDGSTTIGVVDPATMTWYLKNSNSPGAPDIAPFAYGGVGDIPTVGDWQGTGTTSIGVFNTISGDWKLRNSNSPGAPDITRFAYGAPGWTPVPGRFSADVQLLLAAGGAGAGAAPISQTAVDVTVAVALDRLQQAGVNPAVLDRLKGVTAVLQELPPGQLGVVLPQDRQMVLSPDGAGYGWFVDPTPGQDEEFADGLALPAGAADGREDLLTAVLHELAGLAGLAEDGNLLAAGQRNTQALDRIFAAAQQ